jgi:hypothetical protein
MNGMDYAPQLERWLASARGQRFDTVIAGRFLGGKPGETPLAPQEYAITDSGFTIRFGGGNVANITNPATGEVTPVRIGGTEVLEVVAPQGVEATSGGELVVGRAEAVRFGWHYYGRPQTDENWCVGSWTLQGTSVLWDVSGPQPPRVREHLPESFPYPGVPFLRLTPLG